MNARARWIAIAIAAVIVGYLSFFEHETFIIIWRTGWRVILALIGLVFVVLGGRTIYQTAILGENDDNSAPVANPQSLGNRSAGLFLGLIQAGVGITGIVMAINLAAGP